MIPQYEGRPRASRQGTSQIAQLGEVELHDVTPNSPAPQPLDEARRYEIAARLIAYSALRMAGSMAFQQSALGSHYARRAVALLAGGVQ